MRIRLILSFLLIALVSITSVVLIARQGAASEVRNFMFRGGMAGLNKIATDLEEYYRLKGSWEDVNILLRSMSSSPGHGPGGSGGPMSGNTAMSQSILLADASGWLVAGTQGEITNRELSQTELETAINLEVDGQVIGYLIPAGGMRFTQADETFLVNRLNRAALSAGLIAGGVALLLAFWLSYRLLLPVRALTDAAQNLARGFLSQRVSVKGNDELATLGKTFNQMAISLQQAEDSRRAMTADIAHELRNPLAVQRATLEALQDGVYPLKSENLDPIVEQNLLLTRLVNDLQTLALADAGQIALEKTRLDLAPLAQRLVERYQPQARTRNIIIALKKTPNCPPVLVDSVRIEQILGNLLSNALRYTPQDGQINITLECQPDSIKLDVHNSGQSISPDVLPHIFERFYRGEKSRSRSEGGTGLGLAIARKLAEGHGGALTAANHPDGGVVFTLLLPTGEA